MKNEKPRNVPEPRLGRYGRSVAFHSSFFILTLVPSPLGAEEE